MTDIATNQHNDLSKDPPALTNEQFRVIEDELVQLAVHINCATYKMLSLIRELDVHKAAQNLGFISTAHYLNWRIGLDLGASREKVRVARALYDLPLTSEALKCGSISYAKARALTRVATEETEEVLLNVALYGTASHLEKVVRGYRRATDAGLELAEKRHQGRYLHMHHDEDGMLVIQARLPPEEGALFVKAIQAAQELVWKQTPDVSAETSVMPSQKRADALGVLAKAALATNSDTSRFEVVVHVDAEVLKDQNAAGQCQIEDGPDVSAETLRRIACDCAKVIMTHDQKGEILDVGRKTRVIPSPIRRALTNRDHGCKFPGCNRTQFVDAHHIKHWADGGETKLSNLVELCRHHHRFLHEGGFRICFNKDNIIEFIAPSGSTLLQVGTLIPADDEAFSAKWRHIQQEARAVDTMTVWNGDDKIDYGWLLEDLLNAHSKDTVTLG